MANRERGEVDLVVDGTTYTFCLGLNELVELETLVTSTSGREVRFVEVLAKAESGHATSIRALFWAALKKHHPDVTLDKAGEIVQAVGGLFSGKLQALLTQATTGARPDPADVAELGKGGKKRPRTAQTPANGIGVTSTSKPVAVA